MGKNGIYYQNPSYLPRLKVTIKIFWERRCSFAVIYLLRTLFVTLYILDSQSEQGRPARPSLRVLKIFQLHAKKLTQTSKARI